MAILIRSEASPSKPKALSKYHACLFGGLAYESSQPVPVGPHCLLSQRFPKLAWDVGQRVLIMAGRRFF